MPYPNKIIRWTVRVPGCTSWSTHRSERAAHRERQKADQVKRGHKVYAEHEDGSVTGPYKKEFSC